MTEEQATTRAGETLSFMIAAFRNSACASCDTKIVPSSEVYFDLLAGEGPEVVLHCTRCGVNLRYHRKRALMRDESMPLTFDEVNERLETR